jgi:hypothetical protein
MLINDLEYFKRSANYSNTTSGLDHPDRSNLSSEEWYAYPIQDFDYQFNSWGFRGPDYEQFVGKTVNICLGDSFTVNLGGPIEHSWSSQLAQYLNIPTLNLGMDGAGNDAIKLVYDRACEIFDVQDTFVMYSYLHRRLVDNEFTQHVYSDDENFEYFLDHRIPNAFECAIPFWNFNTQEFNFLKHNNLLFFGGFEDELYIDPKKYEYVRGPDWPTYEEYINGITVTQPEIVEEMKLFVKEDFYYDCQTFTNRDGQHMNQKTNKVYADYFHNQWKQTAQ